MLRRQANLIPIQYKREHVSYSVPCFLEKNEKYVCDTYTKV